MLPSFASSVRFFDKYLMEDAAHWFASRILFYEVTPERVDLVDYSVGFGHKDTLIPETTVG